MYIFTYSHVYCIHICMCVYHAGSMANVVKSMFYKPWQYFSGRRTRAKHSSTRKKKRKADETVTKNLKSKHTKKMMPAKKAFVLASCHGSVAESLLLLEKSKVAVTLRRSKDLTCLDVF